MSRQRKRPKPNIENADVFHREQNYASAMNAKCVVELNQFMLKGAAEGDAKLIDICLQKGADPNASGKIGVTALHVASERGDLDLGELLFKRPDIELDRQTHHSYRPIHLATINGHDDFVAMLLAHGADVDAPDMLGRTALHFAVANNDKSIAKLLTEHRADVNAEDSMHNTPLSMATMDLVKPEFVQLLLNLGADANYQRQSCLPLFLECVLNVETEGSKWFEIMSMLLDAGCDPRVVEAMSKKNALHFAATKGNVELVDYLLK